MATVHLTTIPCEPNTVHMAHRMLRFCKIHPRTNNIVHAGFQGCGAFLCAFMSVFVVFARYALLVNVPVAIFLRTVEADLMKTKFMRVNNATVSGVTPTIEA